MKKIYILFVLLFVVIATRSQSVTQGNDYLYYERYKSAETEFQNVLKQNADNSEAWFGLIKSYLLQNKIDEAKDIVAKWPSHLQSEPLYKVAYGSILLQQNKADEADTYFQQALDDTKGRNATVLFAVADAHLMAKAGDANYAIMQLDKAIKRDKRNADLHVLRGDAYRKLLNGTEAYKAYHQALRIDDKHAAAYYQLGKIFVAQNNPSMYNEYFNKAVAADANYAPALYELYYYEFYRDPAKAMEYYKNYLSKSDASVQREYEMTDLLYLNKQYEQAIAKAKEIIDQEKENVKPRMYKLAGYSFAELADTAQALQYMQKYLAAEEDSNIIAKDYETLADLYLVVGDTTTDSTIKYYVKAISMEKDSSVIYKTYKKLADLSKEGKDYDAQASWLEKYYTGNSEATNVDLFNWGLAWYRAENFEMADSVFGIYTTKYPDQSYGYYWQAKSRALQDSSMEQGLAVPTYQKLIEVLQNDTTNGNYKKWIIESYGYLAAYEANTRKDYDEAVEYFEKVLEVDPENADAKKYIAILEKDISKENNNRP